ncbi:MAG TPA: DUF5752 family protein [Thermodesulfobacteriota bacterium]|jgi:hypothetical protein
MNKPFHFYTQLHLIELLGIKAKNPVEVLDALKKVPASSVYYHTHRFLQQHHYLSPEPPNDFAYWISNVLNLEELGESLASIDTVSFKSLEDLRSEYIKILTDYISGGKYFVDCEEGNEFHFMSCKSFILPTPYLAHDLKEFIEILSKITINSIYFHIFEARMRLQRDENDFANWFRNIGEKKLAKDLSELDPYNITLQGLREDIIDLVKRYAKY